MRDSREWKRTSRAVSAMWFRGLGGCRFSARGESRLPQRAFASHHVHHDHEITLDSIEDAARRFDNLSVARTFDLAGSSAALRVALELFDMPEYALHELCRGGGVFDRDVVGDGVEVCQRRLSPDQPSHRPRRVLASSCDTTRPSANAISPRAMPSSTRMRSVRRS